MQGTHYRLDRTILAVCYKDGQRSLVPVPGGAVVELTQSFLDGYRTVDVNWEGKALIMFAQDVRERASLLMDQGWNESPGNGGGLGSDVSRRAS
jgi:hypothetical protein